LLHWAIPSIRWRAHVLLLHASEQIPDIRAQERVRHIMPASD
jgi:hypothetical protein